MPWRRDLAVHLAQAAAALDEGNDRAAGRSIGIAIGHLQRAADLGDPAAAALFDQLQELVDSAEPTQQLDLDGEALG
jgi:hypothetical protein